jgi:hypothetical protein
VGAISAPAEEVCLSSKKTLLLLSDLAPDLWKRESLGYTLSEGGKSHAKGTKNVHT